jgi:RING finger protein 113A
VGACADSTRHGAVLGRDILDLFAQGPRSVSTRPSRVINSAAPSHFFVLHSSLRNLAIAMATPEVTVPFFKKKGKARPTTTRRQRSASPPGAGAGGAGPLASSSKTEVVLPQRKAAANLLSAGTKRKRAEDGAGADAADDDEDARNGPDVQWTAAGSHVDAARGILAGDEAEALAKRVRASAPESDEETLDDGLYHGQKGYKSHIKKSKEIPKSMRVGPQKNASTIRTVTMIDYQPDVCKDYKGASLSS